MSYKYRVKLALDIDYEPSELEALESVKRFVEDEGINYSIDNLQIISVEELEEEKE